MEIYFGNEKLEIYFQFEISISRASANLHRSAFVSRKNLTRNICILCSSQRSTKTKRENPSLFFFFFNAIKAADRHRGLAQRGISQSQLIASSFSFFFFFFFVQSVRRQQKDLFTPYHRQSGNNEIRRVYWPVFLSRRANFITETQSATIKLIVNRDIEIRFAFTTPRDSSFRSDN